MKVGFFRSAADELIEAADSYEGDVRGLGYEFILEVERIVALLGELPSLGEKLDQIHRRIPLRPFPYALIFRHDGDVIRVVAVAHRRMKSDQRRHKPSSPVFSLKYLGPRHGRP